MSPKIYSKSPNWANEGPSRRRRCGSRLVAPAPRSVTVTQATAALGASPRRFLSTLLLASLVLFSCTGRQGSSEHAAASPAAGGSNGSHAAAASAAAAENGGSRAKGGVAGTASAPSGEPLRAAASGSGADAAARAENASPKAGGAPAPEGSLPSTAAGGSEAYVSFASGKVMAAGTAGAPAASTGSDSSTAPAGGTRTLRVGDPVGAGETIATGLSSLVNVRVGGSYDLSLGHDTVVRFDFIGPAPAGSASGEPFRLMLSLHKGSIVVKAGTRLLASLPAQGAGPTDPPYPSLLFEVTTPHLFLSSRGGSVLIADTGDAARCAVGLGSAWLLPSSVVYSDIIDKVAKPAVALLNGILAKAVPLPRDSEVTVLAAKLAPIDTVGSAIRQILTASEGKKELPRATMEALTGLARKATAGVPEAIGKPQSISGALREELDPQSVPKQTMKVTSATENGKPVNESSAGSQTGRPGPATAPGAQNPGTSTISPAGRSTAGPGTGASAPAVGAAAGAGAESAPQTASPAGSAAGTAPGAASSGGFPGPTPPTPPTPPTAP